MTREEAKEYIYECLDYTEATEVVKALEQEPCEDKLAIDRYQDLVDYFSDKDIAKTILGDREEFKKWLDRIKWNVRKVDELARKLEQEPCEDAVSRQAVIDLVNAECVDLQDGSELWRSCVNDTVESIYLKVKDMPPVTPTFPKGATNGDMIKAMFPNELLTSITSTLWWGDNMSFNKDWWNAPYKKEVEE